MYHSEKKTFYSTVLKGPMLSRIMSVLWDIQGYSLHFHVSHFHFTPPLNKRIRVLFNQLIYLSFS